MQIKRSLTDALVRTNHSMGGGKGNVVKGGSSRIWARPRDRLCLAVANHPVNLTISRLRIFWGESLQDWVEYQNMSAWRRMHRNARSLT